MPIRSIDELRNWAGPDWKSASDEDLISMYSRVAKVAPTEVAMTLGYDPGSGGVSAKQLSSSVDRYQAGLYGVGEAVTGAIGLNKASGWLAEQRRANELQADVASARAREMGAVDTWKDVKDVGDFGSYAKSLAIQSLPYAGEAVVGGLAARGLMSGTRAALAGAKTVEEAAAAKKALDLGSTVGGVAASYPSAVGDILSNQREQSGKTDLLAAGGLAIPYAGLNALGVDSALMRGGVFRNTINLLDRPGGLLGAAARTVATGTGVALKEGISETGQEVINQAGRMAVDPNATLTDPEALERYKESFAGGATLGGIMGGGLGGWRRSAPATNEIQQAFDQPSVSGTPTTNVAPPPAPPAPQQNVPAVVGGTTDIAQAQKQAQLDNQTAQIQQQQADQAQVIQAQRDSIASYFGAEPAVENGKLVGGTIFGKSYADPEKFNTELDKLAQNESVKTETRRAVEKAYMDSLPPEKRKLNTIQSGALQFWANKPDIAAAAAAINEAMSELVVKGKGIDDPKVTQFAQMYEALTGTEAPAYDAATKVKPKGAKDGKLPVQTVTGVGAVPIQGGPAETNAGVIGNVQPSGVQSLGTGGLPEGSLGLQVGQQTAEGIRTGTSGVSDVVGGNAPSQVTAKPSPETNQLLRQLFGDSYAIDEKVPPATIGSATRVPGKAGQVYVQPSQTGQSGLSESVPASMAGERVVKRKRRWNAADSAPVPGTNQYYSSAVEHIHPTKRSEIILGIFVKALEPQTDRGDEFPAIIRAQILKMSLMEQMTSAQISQHFAEQETPIDISAGSIDTQRRRMGLADDRGVRGIYFNTEKEAGRQLMQDVVKAASEFKTDAFPDGIGPDQLKGFYAAKNSFATGNEVVELSDEVFEEPVSRTTDVKLQEELYKSTSENEATQSMGQIASAGGSQGNVDSLKQTRKDKKTGKVYKDISALAQIEELTNEADTIRDTLMDMAPKDPRREGLVSRLEAIGDVDSGEIGNLFQEYNKAQQLRSKEAEEAGVIKKEEVEATKEELTGEELAASEREDERRADAEEKAKADQEGETNAVQEPSTEEVPVQKRTGGGKAVGKGNAKRGKAAGKTEAKPEPKQEAKPEEIKTPAEEWADISKLAPELPPYDVLAKSEKTRWDDLVRRGQANLAAAVKIIGEKPQPAGTAVANEKPETTGTDGTAAPVTAENEIPAPKSTLFSKTARTTESKNSVYNIWNTLLKLFDVAPADSAYKDFIRVSQTTKEAYEAAGKKVPLAQLQNAQAFIDPTDDRIVHLIADNIAKGSELAVLLHEVGVHVGLKKKLGANFKILESQVKAWANSPKGSLERQVYERAMARVAAARMDGAISADIAAEELVAYAAEEAALAGVKVKDAPRSRLEVWVKQLHDIASQAFKRFFKINNVPELSVQDLVNFSFAAAQEHLQAHRSEIGATVNATESQIAKYYAGARGTYEGTSVVENEDRPGPGEESFFWSPADKFGSFTEIGTRGFYSPANPSGAGPRGVGAPEYAAMVVTSAESRAFGDEQKNNQDKVLLTFQATRDRQTNIWSLIVSGPDIDSALYVDLYVEGLATTTKDNEGNEWSRLEGISGRDNLRLLGEFRRRLTRMKNGEIPNIDFVRVTGSGAAKEDGRPGVYAADTLATRFSKAPTADQVIGALPKPLQKSARSQWTNIKTLAKRGLYASAITEDVIGLAKKYMPSAAKYLQAQYARQGTRLEFEKRIENILSRFDKLPANLKGEGKGSVNEYIHDSTREKKWGYYPGEQQVGTKLFEVDPDFEERFNKIQAQSPAAAQLIKDVFRHGYEALRLKQLAAENAVNREFDSRIKAAGNDADLLQSLNKEKRQMLKRITSLRNVNVSDPYAYLGRYGDYVVVAKSKEFIAYEEAATGTRSSTRGDSIVGDPQQAKNWLQDNVSNPLHYVVQFAETQGEADDIAAELQATGQYDVQPEDAGIKEANASYAGGSDVHMAVARLRNLAQRQTESTDGKLEKAISDLYLMTVAEASARRSELERKNVSGADKNMMRNLATSGRADAHFLATMEHSDELNDALEAMRNEARNNRKDAMPLYNELYTRYADSMEYSQPSVLAQNLLRMSTLWNLSTSPAYYLQQVLQTSVLSLPYMAGRLGYFRSARAIKRAYGDMSDLVAGLGISDHIDFDKAPADVRFMLKELVNMGKIDIGMDADARARTDEQGALGKVMFKLQGINTRIEAINRATAAIAAYRGYMDRYKGATGADGVRFAADVVSNTHGNYDGFNTPRIMQSGGAKVLLQFKRFQIIQLSMLAKLIHTSFKGAKPEERAIARASLKYITAHMAVLGGALGVPFVSQAASILSSVFGDEDEPDDYEFKLRRMIGNDAVADLLLRGVPAALGLETLGKRLSMENVASPFGPFVDFNLTSRADAAQMIVGMMGPSVGLGLKFVDALGMMSKGNYYKGLELALPNGIGNVMKGYRFATEGITMRNGDLVMKPEEISMIDAAFQAVGLPTSTITDRQYTQKVVAEFDKFYASRAGEIKASYVEGSRQSDAAAMAEARDDWQKLQESRVKNGYKRQSMSELFRAPAEARKRERSVVGGVETTKSNRRFVESQVNP